ncbi:hypothetical protein V7S43_015529 [Phytophthora oleae]|uniref:Uncharacterized protein n=1 Tax=Phytophthora oleae TaxID=2107226 RepID=A0ABD3EZ35_9STRA
MPLMPPLGSQPRNDQLQRTQAAPEAPSAEELWPPRTVEHSNLTLHPDTARQRIYIKMELLRVEVL